MRIAEEHMTTAKHIVWGVVGGAVLLAIVGFKFGGWHTAGQARDLAKSTAETAVVQAMAPVCAAAFARDATTEQKAAFKAAQSYARSDVIRKTVLIPGMKDVDYALANACGALIDKMATQAAK